MKMNKIASIEIQNKKVYVFPVLSFLDSIISNHNAVDIGRYNKLRYVVGEVLKNRIETSYPGGDGSIWVDLFLSDTFFEVSIRDKGVPQWASFDYEKDNITADGKDLRNYILDMWMDGVGMEKLGKDGQRVYIRIKIKNKFTFVKPEPYAEITALDNNISIRPVLTEEDAIEAIRCVYSEYGYSYSYENMYYVDSFMRMIRNKEIMSFLAVNDHGQTAGHFALAFSDMYENMPEISSVVIRREFRGLGLFAMFVDHCIKVGKENNFRALMGQPVAFHPMSQKAVIKAGFTATSLLLSYLGSDVESEYNENAKRLDLTACVKILDDNATSRIYPPKELIPFISKMYDRLGWKYEICDSIGAVGETLIKVEDISTLKMKKIIIREASVDLEKILHESVKDALCKKNEMLELVISLSSPSCEYAYEAAKKCKFVISGLIPGGAKGDYLIMQRLLTVDRAYDHLVLIGEFEELKNDIIEITCFDKETK